jgi:hypothetical protein
MSEPICDTDAVSGHRADAAKTSGDDPEQTTTNEARPCLVPVRPGYGRAAYKAGCEDEWIDSMSARYGGEW